MSLQIRQKILVACARTGVNESTVISWMKELKAFLKHLSFQPVLQIKKIPKKNIKDVCKSTKEEDFNVVAINVGMFMFKKYKTSSTVIICNNNHHFAKLAKASCEKAVWGVANGPLALVYGKLDKYLLWHETLHLLGAKDCYNVDDPVKNPGPNCKMANCIMQYEPSKKTVGSWPFLCKKNCKLIEKRLTM